MSHHSSFVKILDSLFPSKTKAPASPFDEDTVDIGQAPTVEMAVAQINKALSW